MVTKRDGRGQRIQPGPSGGDGLDAVELNECAALFRLVTRNS